MSSYHAAVIKSEVQVIGILAQELHQFLAGLSDDELNAQSACDAWTVRDVAGHLTNRAERQIASMTRARAGDSSPPDGFTAPADMMTMSATNAAADIAYSRALGPALVSTFERRYHELLQLLDSFTGDDWHCPCWHPRRGTMTAREYVSQRIQELAIHDWDIRSALDANAGLHPDAVPTLLGMSAHWLRAAYNPGDTPPTKEVSYRFALTDAAAVDALVGPAGAQVSAELHQGKVDLTVECDANTYLLLAYGRLNLNSAAASGRLRAVDPDGLLPQFARWTAGF